MCIYSPVYHNSANNAYSLLQWVLSSQLGSQHNNVANFITGTPTPIQSTLITHLKQSGAMATAHVLTSQYLNCDIDLSSTLQGAGVNPRIIQLHIVHPQNG